ncbi:vanadium-dependent haloperoxidase [Virgibacillus sp. W0181]|uniref:vanadium-dependent haloperoxidase n=1 Tax=Virgibacillus sp. W0181 TaxID=3391581 RepID=UPI003F4723B6
MSSFLKWSDVPYGGEKHPPNNPVDQTASSWPMHYFTFENNKYLGPDGENVRFTIRHPDTIDWHRQLRTVQRTLKNITPDQIKIATYWGTGAATKQWTPIIDRLIDTYNLTPTRAARVLASVQAGINDTFVIVWYYKFLWNVARPIQYDPSLQPIIYTPRFPTYISGHAAVSGCTQTILSYFFPAEARRLKALAEENAQSRLYASVHFPVDNEEGLSLGRQIGTIIINQLRKEETGDGTQVDVYYRSSKHANLQPPPYKQAIPFDFDEETISNTGHSNKHSKHKHIPKPKIFFH